METMVLVKNKKNTLNYVLTMNRINTYWRFKKKKIEVLMIPVAIESLLYLTPSLAKGKFICPLKH